MARGVACTLLAWALGIAAPRDVQAAAGRLRTSGRIEAGVDAAAGLGQQDSLQGEAELGDPLLRGWLDHVQNLQVHMLQEVPEEQLPPSYHFETKFFQQRVDHVNKQNRALFWQRYFVVGNFTSKELNHPLFVFCGAEQGDIYKEWKHYGFMMEVARRQAAKVIFLEHRYFGQSVPFGQEAFLARPDRVGLLSLDQSLADYAAIIREHKGDGPVVTFGGSLSGTMAALLRIQYPELVDMAFASSAPVFGVPGVADPFAWRARVV